MMPRPTDKLIRKLTFEPTYKCGLRCKMCFFWGEHSAKSTLTSLRGQEELQFAEIRDVLLPQCLDCAIGTIALAGGEPLLRPDAIDILELFRHEGVSTMVESSLALELNNQQLCRLGENCNYLWTSIDGLEASHNTIRGRPNAYSQTIGNLRRLLQRLDVERPRVIVNFVLQQKNICDVAQVARMLMDIGVDAFRVQLMSWTDNVSALLSTGNKQPHVATLPPQPEMIASAYALEQLMGVQEMVIGAGKRFYSFPPIIDMSCELLDQWYNGAYQGMHFGGCGRLERPRIDPYGNVHVCVNGGPLLGNIRETNLRDIWQSWDNAKFADELARHRPRECHTCCKQSWVNPSDGVNQYV